MYRVPPRAPENIVSIDEGHQTEGQEKTLPHKRARSLPPVPLADSLHVEEGLLLIPRARERKGVC